jgi:hypothetical protein
MSIYDAIQSAIFTAQQNQGGQQQAPDQSGALLAGIGGAGAALAQAVDVEQALEGISAQKGNPNLNWRTSIVDLMKLLDLDSSLQNRAQLATELGYTGEKNGSAEMNIWLHRRVMDELERNGGTVPDTLKH